MSRNKRRDLTTLLPSSLREQIESQGQGNYGHQYLRRGPKSRKERRILDKTAKKERKVAYFAHQMKRKNTENTEEGQPPRKRPRLHENATKGENLQSKKKVLKETEHKEIVAKARPLGTPLKGSFRPKLKPKTILSQAEVDEDREIAWLEYKLGLSSKEKGKSLDKLLEKDGLGDILDGIDDLFMAGSGSESGDSDSMEDGDVDPYEEARMNPKSGDNIENDDSDERNEEEEKEESGPFSENEEAGSQAEPMVVRTAPSNAEKYVPPHLRNAPTDDARRTRLLRHLKGLMNKLSEQNIATIISSVEEVYLEHARNDVTTCLTSVIIEAISSDTSLLDNHISLNAALVACLYRAIGIEFAAYFVQEVVNTYDNVYQVAENRSTQVDVDQVGKESLNIIVCVAELYNFEVISYVLLYDIIRQLISENMGELQVELLLKILRISGRQLRQDDPLALKDIVQLVSDNLSVRKGELSSRTRFMIETLTNLKNNRIKKADAPGVESVDRMRKFISNVGRRYTSKEPLRVTLSDLRAAETKGKWWLVGAAWSGDPLMDTKKEPLKEAQRIDHLSTSQQKLLALAKKQGMNTDIRRSIFVVLMSSDDYFDACERLAHLNLNEHQQREIIRVLLHCCGNERVYNPYYSLVGQRLCEQSYSYKVTTQYCLWDFLRELGAQEVGGEEMLKKRDSDHDFTTSSVSKERGRNIAKLYAWWIAKGAATLTILKPIDFLRVKPETQDFLDTMFRDIFVDSQVSAPLLSSSGLAALLARSNHRKEPLEKLMLQAARHEALAQGLLLYLSGMKKRWLKMKMKPDEGKFLNWAAGTAKEALETGTTLVPPNDLDD